MLSITSNPNNILEVESYLKNLDFDFTYPEDFHDEAKRGKPLDKICFIGQSATGKTGLLELIKEQHYAINSIIVNDRNFSFKNELKL
jgi:ATPase subunit of ABC transporter with duplicated ATPase domains